MTLDRFVAALLANDVEGVTRNVAAVARVGPLPNPPALAWGRE
jgi:hypothetical protein